MQQPNTPTSRKPHGLRNRPRVVILDDGDSARVAVLDLPESVRIGASFCHFGSSWRVTGKRPHSRVFIAEREH